MLKFHKTGSIKDVICTIAETKNRRKMKIYPGKYYETIDGRTTGRITLNTMGSIMFPYHSQKLGISYDENGISDSIIESDVKCEVNAAGSPLKQYDVDTITISASEYKRLKDIESHLKLIWQTHREMKLEMN